MTEVAFGSSRFDVTVTQANVAFKLTSGSERYVTAKQSGQKVRLSTNTVVTLPYNHGDTFGIAS